MARNKRAIPEINAGSMADIAFLLLIFFLVTTTMDVDKGINRKLPPYDDELVEDPPPIKKRNIFEVLVNSNDALLVEEEYLDISRLREEAKKFLNNNGDGTCDYCDGGYRDPKSSDNPDKAVISLQNDRGTSYSMYLKVQNELAAALNELRDELAVRMYGKEFAKLDKDQKKEIRKRYPQKISEAEQLKLGG
ncbi:MAG: biopolymer transporter ExbD [Schleiferiaceae bacterium]|jgi:biopolymer transport protein ExbD|nr:biopolymer transporter ExbD [Schleiferiaceae bacterium]